jgi:hypothetical protein
MLGRTLEQRAVARQQRHRSFSLDAGPALLTVVGWPQPGFAVHEDLHRAPIHRREAQARVAVEGGAGEGGASHPGPFQSF